MHIYSYANIHTTYALDVCTETEVKSQAGVSYMFAENVVHDVFHAESVFPLSGGNSYTLSVSVTRLSGPSGRHIMTRDRWLKKLLLAVFFLPAPFSSP